MFTRFRFLCSVTLTLCFVGCGFLNNDLSETDFDRILQSYKEKNDRVLEARAHAEQEAIRSLTVVGKGDRARISAEFVDAERVNVVEQIVSQLGLAVVYQNVRLGGRISATWKDLPLEVALNRMSAGDGVQATVRNGVVTFHPFDPGVNIASIEFGAGEVAQPVAPPAVAPAPISASSVSSVSTEPSQSPSYAPVAIEPGFAPSVGGDWISREIELDNISNIDAAQVLLAIVPNSGTAPMVPSYVETGGEFGNISSGGSSYTQGSVSNSGSSYGYNSPPPPDSMKEVRFSVVPGKNSILLHGPAEQVARASQVIRQSDQLGDHVVIEALIVEVDTQALERVGSQITSLQDSRWSGIATSFGDLLGNAITFTNTAGADNSFAFSAIIDLLIAEDRARVISRPYITALTGQPATVNIATQQYVVAESSQNGATVTTTEPISAGVVLKIVPYALATGSIRMNVDVEQSEFIPTSGDNVSVSVDRNSATATMQVESGRSVVIGGLMVDSEAKGNSGFPFLRHIPVLNYLFAKQSAEQEEREVIVFVTPHLWTPSMKAPLVDPVPLALHKRGPNRKSYFESLGTVPLGLDPLKQGEELSEPLLDAQ